MGDVDPKPETQEEPPQEESQEEEKPADEEAEPAGGEEKAEDPEAEPTAEGAEEKKEAQAAATEEPEEKRKRVGGWQRKIDRLERQNQQLLDQLGQRPAQPQGGQPAKDQTPEEKATAYIDGLVEQRLTKRDQERQQRAAQAEFSRRTAEVRARRPDFDELIDSVAHIPVSQAVNEALLISERPGDIMCELASNPAELARISALPPIAAAREIGRLEAQLTSSTPPPVKPKSAIRPPAPPTSVNGSASSTRSLEDLPLSDYKRAYRSGRR